MSELDIERIKDDVAELQKQTAGSTVLVEKLDATLEKLAEMSNELQSISVLHSHKFEDQEKQHETLSRQLDNRTDSFDQEIQRLHSRLTDMSEIMDSRLKKIEVWQWLIIGGATVVGWILSQIFPFDFS